MTGGGGSDWGPAPAGWAPVGAAGVGRMTGGGREDGCGGCGPSLGGGGRLASGSFLLPNST